MSGAIESARLLVLLRVRLPRFLLILLLLLLHPLFLLTLLPHVLTKAGDGGVHAARRPGYVISLFFIEDNNFIASTGKPLK